MTDLWEGVPNSTFGRQWPSKSCSKWELLNPLSNFHTFRYLLIFFICLAFSYPSHCTSVEICSLYQMNLATCPLYLVLTSVTCSSPIQWLVWICRYIFLHLAFTHPPPPYRIGCVMRVCELASMLSLLLLGFPSLLVLLLFNFYSFRIYFTYLYFPLRGE